MTKRIIFMPVVLIALMLFACGSNESEPGKQTMEIHVLHAGSLSIPFKEMAGAFMKKYPGYKVLLEAHGSRTCARQITDLHQYVTPNDVEDTEFTTDLYELIQAFARLLQEPPEEVLHEVFDEVISIEDKMEEIKNEIIEKGSMRFSDLFKAGRTRNLLIASFFALSRFIVSSFLENVETISGLFNVSMTFIKLFPIESSSYTASKIDKAFDVKIALINRWLWSFSTRRRFLMV